MIEGEFNLRIFINRKIIKRETQIFCLSRMQGDLHLRFLGGKSLQKLTYPTLLLFIMEKN